MSYLFMLISNFTDKALLIMLA